MKLTKRQQEYRRRGLMTMIARLKDIKELQNITNDLEDEALLRLAVRPSCDFVLPVNGVVSVNE